MHPFTYHAIRFGAFFALALLGSLPGALFAQSDVVGRWEGTLETPQGDLRVVLEIEETAGGLVTTMYSLDQTPDAIPTESTSFEDGALMVDVPAVLGGYEGTLNEEGGIAGTWSQNGQSLELNLEKVEG